MADELVERYKRLNQDLTQMERDLEELKLRRAMAAGALFARDGKGVVYDLGDGVPMLIVQSKNKTHFFTPKDKWKKVERQPKPKKVIVDGRVVEVPRKVDLSAVVTAGSRVGQPAEHVKIAPELRGRTEVAIMIDDDGGFTKKAEEAFKSAPSMPPPSGIKGEPLKFRGVQAPEPVTAPKQEDTEIDPLVAALAEIGRRV